MCGEFWKTVIMWYVDGGKTGASETRGIESYLYRDMEK
jgi:hypothetical protein